ncbi:NAD(P)/FAD-dependent oxidoreductase [Arthrobacter psychrochitiniphilus]|uniref:FAD-dependent oxidoreductase n=1 Tax=Arthrobacter psychrochitiniphilus TaxID=291045 RepID=A0A2V3DY25_9MICC|nr:FAD-dependent oxidoreductase [Arthrobacter psychrochitiniphilus]NYG17205.1 3-phenylpropionate/trans-cinnamate dioxygenase ferredoxin reductase subunit [Arthrobacter psychrochitiniphilus]PXA65507.1 FAD-dependent oxidoreductase [Arthrobacter psychrochitiniphilus]
MGAQETFVIVGAGLAGAKTAQALREEGFAGRIVLLGQEPERPYERPPLSKDFLQGKSEREKIFVHAQSWYAEHNVELRTSTKVTGIDRSAHRVDCARGGPVSYDKLLLATGASPRQLSVPGSDRHRVYYLRRIEDSQQLKFALSVSSRVAILGAGWIGLEVAAAARAAGLEVTVLERGELPLQRILGTAPAEIFAKLHRDHGVDLRCGVQGTRIIGDDPRQPTGVALSDGSQLGVDLVVAGIGAVPNTLLAQAAGLELENGVMVDKHLRSSDPDIYAAGDVANAFHPLLGKHIRSEHWYNALSQPAVAARSMLGQDAVYAELPYFYSDQYELGMEYSGYVAPGGYDEIIFRGDPAALTFMTFWIKDRRVLAGMNVNIWNQTETIKALVRCGRQVDVARLADSKIPLERVLAEARAGDG